MNYPHIATTDLYTFSLWPDSSEQVMVWPQIVGYAQQGFTNDNFSFGDLDVTAAWGQSATPTTETYGLQNTSRVSTAALRI